jgi:GNAT superfamily N-acetyltransferase
MGDAAFTALTTQRLVVRRFRPRTWTPSSPTGPIPGRPLPELGGTLPAQPGAPVPAGTAGHPPDTPGAWFQFAVALRRTDRLIGDCAAHIRADDTRQAEIGFTLAPEHQGHGHATEAVRRLLHYLLIERGKHRVSATCDDRNIRSAAVLQRVGMRREGHLLESTWAKGEWTSDLLYAVLRREWPTSR